jgi:hypothetical protein
MGIFSNFRSLFSGRAPASSSTRASSPPSGDRFDITAEFNHKLGPLDRGDRYENPLDDFLRRNHWGETKEGEILFIDVHLLIVSPPTTIPLLIEFLNGLGAPKGSLLHYGEEENRQAIAFGVREGFAIYLDGVNLPPEVYRTTDSNVVVNEINQRLAKHGKIEAHWQGSTETALYIYGDSIATMKPLIADFMATYPLCQGARVVDLTPP